MLKNKMILASLLAALISAPALADDDWDDDDDDYRPRATRVHQGKSSTVNISRERAKSIAKARYAKAHVTDVELEHKNGRVYYQIDLEDRQYDYEVWVDAKSGKIIRTKRERNDD